LAHSTLFGGNLTTEPITLKAKFTNISSDFLFNSKNNLESKSSVIDFQDSDTISNSTSGFDLGLVVGIIIGVAIVISLLLVFRQKNT
jgi:hypothetical protein